MCRKLFSSLSEFSLVLKILMTILSVKTMVSKLFYRLSNSRNLINILVLQIQGGEFKSIVVENWRFFANGSGYC